MCEFTNFVFIIASSVASFFLPCIGMSCMYTVILKRLKERSRRKGVGSGKRGDLPSQHNVTRNQIISVDGHSHELFGKALLDSVQWSRDVGKRLRAAVDDTTTVGYISKAVDKLFIYRINM